MKPGILTALVAIALLASGCDSTADDSDTLLFVGTWEITEVESANTDYSSLVLGRYDKVVIAFVEEEDDFNLLLDVHDSPSDVFISGLFDVDSNDRELDLSSAAFGGTFDFDYVFENADTIILTTEDDDPVLETIFGVSLDLERIIVVLRRTS